MQGSKSSSFEKFPHKKKKERKLNQGNPHRTEKQSNKNKEDY